jgi:hypothetical protein
MLLYYAGIAAGIAYLVGDIVGGMITPDYSYRANAVSELVQSGAENRAFLSSFLFVHALCIVLFSVGVLANHSYQENRFVFIAGIGLLVVGICHALSSSIFPQDPVGSDSTTPGTMHLVLVGITVVVLFIVLPLMGQGMFVDRGWDSFRTITFICLPIMIVGGILTPVVIGTGIEAMGVMERRVGYIFYLWLGVLAYKLVGEIP